MFKLRTTITLLLATLAPATFAEDVINFTDHIRPIMQQSCLNCHNADRARGGLDLTTYSALMAGGSGGEIVVAQDPDGSRLLGVMAHTLEPKMPPNGGKVGDDKLTTIRLWIEQGLRETADSAAAAPTRPRVDLSVGEAAIGRPDGPPIMPVDMPLGPIHHTPRPGAIAAIAGHPWSPIVAVSGQRQVLVYHTGTGDLLGVLPFDYGQPEALRFSWTGKLLMVGGGVGGQSGTVALYDVTTGDEVARVGEEVDAVLAADLDPTQRIVALGGPNKLVKGYDVATGELAYKIDKHTEWVTAVAFSPAGDTLATADRNGGLHIWEADTGLPVLTLEGHRAAVTGLAWRFDGKLLASVGEDGQLKIWEMEEGKQVKAWNAHRDGAQSVAYAEDGRLVTTGRDRQVRVWDGDGKQLHNNQPFAELALSAAFDTAGQSVIAGDLDGKLVRWSLQGDAKEVVVWDSNPPTVAVALARSAEQAGEAASALSRHRETLERQRSAAMEARRAMTEADQAHAQAREALSAAEQQMARAQAEHGQVRERRQSAMQALRSSREQLGLARDAMRTAEAESGQARKNHAAAREAFDQIESVYVAKQAELVQARQAAEQTPEDNAAIQRVARLNDEVEALSAQRDAASAEADRQADALAKAEESLVLAEQTHERRRAEADRAGQQHEMAGREFGEKAAVLEAAREAAAAAKAEVGSAEQHRSQCEAAQAQAEQSLVSAEQAFASAEAQAQRTAREHAKWRSAELRLEIDALRGRLADARLAEHPAVMTRDERVVARDAASESLARDQALLAQGPAEMQAKRAAVEQAKEQAGETQRRRDAMASRLGERERVLATQRAAVASLIDQAGGSAESDDAVKQAIAQARAAEQTLAQGVASAQEALEDAELDLEDAQFNVESTEFAVNKLRDTLDALPARIARGRQAVADAEGALATAERALVESRQPGDAIQAEIDAMMERYLALRTTAGFDVIE